MSRRFDSGAQKRKLKKEREKFQNKLPKLTGYFSSNQSNSQSNEQGQYTQNVDYENENIENYPTYNEIKTGNEDIVSTETSHTDKTEGSSVITTETNAGYAGILELIAEFDPFLKQHINMYANKGRGNVSYLSKTICEEFIELLSRRVLTQIKNEIKESKYWGLVVDSTPDISHVDQLSVIFRYYFNGHIHERFFCFLQITSHKGKSLSTEILQLLEEHDINIADCRAQTYDNASNMSGKYSGLQSCLKEQNKLAFYVPCVAHSLNLVGECSVDECIYSKNYFGLLQRLYSFFGASTHRWNVLKNQNNSKLTSLSATRWSCRADASKNLIENFDGIYEALSSIAEDKDQKSDTRHEATSLLNSMIKLENVFMAVFWHRILNRFNIVSKFLQQVEIDLNTASNMLFSLIEFVKNLRDEFSKLESESKELSQFVNQEYSNADKRRKTKKLCNGGKEMETLEKSDKFRIENFYTIIDKLIIELQKRSEAYSQITGLFGFLTKLLNISRAEMQVSTKNLVEVYFQDLEEQLMDELEQFIPLLKLQPEGFFSNRNGKNDDLLNPLKVLNWIINSDMIDVFPNVCIAYRLFLTTPVANCEAERSFSVLKRIKNLYRTTMLDSRLSSLARLAIETELLRTLNFDDVIREFAEKKCRKKHL
ncbi:PREDICTED: zinc finger MYM-type protein 1-like [Vollenhovia emeryi]|uniref:zinc finger MYM-type protein 1-like n=1 Tax=Vollenhovia emeryi TaxID=411798 RepID=UPI0005F51F5C|nr:PREDICTED: zinc finger MYM-type protein 1-like [Vollenhovia emeryi]